MELSTKLFSLLEDMGMHCSVTFFSNNKDPETFFSDEIERPLEREIMATARHAGRLVDFGHRTMVNENNVSLLIRDMPIDDEIRYGMIKDNICFVIAAIQTKVIQLDMEQEIISKENSIYTSNQVIAQILADLEENSLNLTRQSTQILQDMTSDMRYEFSSLNITETEESRIMEILTNCSDTLHTLFTKNKETDTGTRELLSDLINLQKVR
jgi:hypothetical protein